MSDMGRRRFGATVTAVFSLLGIVFCSTVRAEDVEPRTAEELFQRSGRAYRALETFEVTLTTSVEIPQAERGERVVRWVLGEGREAVLDIGSVMRVVVTKDRVYAERAGVRGRYLEVATGGDLAAALATARGRSALAGFWEPPQSALRERKTIAGVLDAFRYSSLLAELSVAGFERAPDSDYEVSLEAENGGCTARFDSETFFVDEVEYVVEPPGAPEGYAMHVLGRFEVRQVPDGGAGFTFDRGDREAVESLRDLDGNPPGISEPPEAILSPVDLSGRLLGLHELATAVRERRVLLVGENHLYKEPPAYLTALLDELHDAPANLLLELPRNLQPAIDDYLRNGNEAVLDAMFNGKRILQLQHVLRWAHEHRTKVPTVLAFDEPQYERLLKRAYLTDTRNRTMARAITRLWREHPDRRVVAYGGQLHMMKTGRYRVDEPSRDTAGSRLPALGVPPHEIASVMLSGGENFRLHILWEKPGALPMDGDPARIPVAYLIDYPIFDVAFADEASDYFVNLGPLTKIEVSPESR
jgi:hypothetical protein